MTRRLFSLALIISMACATVAMGQPAPAPAPATPAPAPAAPAPAAEAPAAPSPAAPAPATPAAPEAPAPAPVAPAPAPAAAPAPASAPSAADELRNAVENFWHYGKIARYDLAAAEAQKIIANKDKPAAILEAFEKVSADRKDNLDQWLLRWQGTQQLREPTNQIIALINEGHRARRSDPRFIEDNIKELASSGRGYLIAIQRLRDSGELAVPIMIDYLRDPARSSYHNAIRNALRDLGRLALNPLVATTEARSPDLLIPVVAALGDIGYSASVPYLARLANAQGTVESVRSAATQALMRMGGGDPRSINAAEAFYQLGERFYYDNADITADKRDPKNPANVWYWDESKGLIRKEVPQVIFNEIMAMRACEYSLKLGVQQGDALSLWLASNYKREAELPEGATDPTREPNQPPAHYYGVSAGQQYLNAALARALRDRNSQVALPVIKSMQQIVGNSNMGEGQGSSLINAMGSPDRLVRFEAAFAIAAALPQKSFQGQERVVPLLAEAMSQTGTPAVLIVVPSQDQLNAVVDAMHQANYQAVGATAPEAAVAAANQLPAVDVIIVSEEIGAAQVDQLLALAAQSGKLAGSAKLIVTRSAASPYVARVANEPLMSVTQASDPAGLKVAADAARAKAASIPIDQAAAATYALRAAELLERLAISREQILDLAPAAGTLLASLNDARPDVVKAGGRALGFINVQSGQAALLAAAMNEKTADDVKISLLKSLANNAKFFGNQLAPDQVAALEKTVSDAANLDVRSAAAEARGALNLPAQQAKTLIVQQSKL